MSAMDNRRILMIDDNESIHEDFRKIFLSGASADEELEDLRGAFLGAESTSETTPTYDLEFALQGQDGWQKACQAVESGCPFAMAFVDGRMPPGWDGIKTIQHLWDADPDLQVVICTAYSDYSLEEIIEHLGNSDRLLILKKPFDPVEVRQLANALTEKWNLMRKTRAQLDNLEKNNSVLLKAQQVAEAASQAKSDFLANMSHEIRTPMTAILGHVDLIRDGDATEGEREAYYDIIRSSGQHLLDIINDILDVSKIEAGRVQINASPASIRELASSVVTLLGVRAQEVGLSLDVDVDPSVPEWLELDAMRVRQVLLNLAGNGLKFTDQGGVSIRIRSASKGQDVRLEVEVEDTGIGIPVDQQPHIFEAFNQGDNSSTRKAGGTGLGLTISKHLTNLMGGDIRMRSTPGNGSIFTATFDVALASPPAAEVEPEVPAPLPRAPREPEVRTDSPVNPVDVDSIRLHGRVLLAEDTPLNQALVSAYLRKAGAEVSIAENGQRAIEMIEGAEQQDRGFDLVLMDMQMPVLDGYGAVRQLRSRGYTGKIIALTAHAMEGDREKCIDAGCDDYATKPLNRLEFLTLCRASIDSTETLSG